MPAAVVMVGAVVAGAAAVKAAASEAETRRNILVKTFDSSSGNKIVLPKLGRAILTHPLPPPSPFPFNVSQHQGLFQ